MSAGPPLLELVQGLLERTYRVRSDVPDLGSFVIGDVGFRRLYGTEEIHRAASAQGDGAQVLVRHSDGPVRACIYFPDAMIRLLEARPPQRGLDDTNVDAFATFVEEVDHLLLLAERAAFQRPVTLFEMELHANVSKHLVLSRFAAGRSARLTDGKRQWLRHHLFGKRRFRDEQAEVRQRYRDACRWAVRLLDRLGRHRAEERIDLLRRFHDANVRGKMELIGDLA